MDVWAWVDKLTDELEEAGQDRVASLFYRFTNHVADQEIPQAEALLPEAMAAAKAMENPWAEVFFRHWEMRLRLGVKGEGESALPAVVDLLDFAHSKECEACPQTMCTTQDIADCYANIDGPGWAEERRAVAEEGLAKIDPSWNCFSCLSHEFIWALFDEKRYGEALEHCDRFLDVMKNNGKELGVVDYVLRADILLRLDRAAEALEMLDEGVKLPDYESDRRRRMSENISRVDVLTALGRHEEAWDALPFWDDLTPGDYKPWLLAAGHLALLKPEHNSWGIGSCFQKGIEYFSRVGAHRAVMDVGALGVDLAAARGSYSSPRRIVRLMRLHLPKLRRSLGADALLAERENTVSDLSRPALPVPAAELLAHLREAEDRDAEKEMDLFYSALEELPDDTDLLLTACSALSAMNANGEARELLWAYVRRHPTDCDDAADAIIRYTPFEQTEELHELAQFLDASLPAMAHWTRLYIAYRNQDRAQVVEQAQKYLAERPDTMGARIMWANTAMRAKEFVEAVRLRQELVTMAEEREGEDENNYRWDLLVAATCAGDWKLVRDTSIAMGFEVEPGDTPIDDPGQYVRIRYEEDGGWNTAIAQRNGPVTARIVSGFWTRQTQRMRDLVVFDPELLEPYPEDEQEREYFYPPYALVHTLEKGGYQCWFVDGFYPGQDEFNRFRDTLAERELYVDVRCEADYTITDPDWQGDEEAEPVAVPDTEGTEDTEGEDAPFPSPGRLDGIYFLLGAPADFPLAELDAILIEETKDWAHPLCWQDLAKAAGKSPERHAAHVERYGL